MKTRKLFGIAALALVLGVVGCDKPDNPDNPEEPAHVCSPVSEWSSNGSKHWHACSDATCKIKNDEAAHDFTDAVVVKPATCDEAGENKQTCKVCGYEKKGTIAKLTHVYVKDGDADKVTWTTEPDCVTAGVGTKHCTLCDKDIAYEVDALGHTYQKDDQDAEIVTWTTPVGCDVDGVGTKYCTRCKQNIDYSEPMTGHSFTKDENEEDIVTWTQVADCLKKGIGTKHCENCKQEIPYEIEPLGHDIKLIGDESEPEAGKAKVRLYSCQRDGCEQTYFGFKANEPSEASKPHLVINEEGGARFWGRPIGNDVVLNESGDATEDAHEAVFNAEQPGDFFEYIFDLSQDQVNALGPNGACRLFCEANAAQWMSNNNMDFWACKSGDTDWTRGMYVETTETHTAGEDIDTYRYILYVDDVVQDFDPKITAPAKDYQTRVEYELPFTFHLHTGTNKIRLVMAGGYRSTFYNFTFRPVDPEAELAFKNNGDKFADVQPIANKFESGYEMVAADCDGQNAPVSSNKDTRLGKGGVMSDVWDITGIPSGMYDVYVKAAYSQYNGSSYLSGKQNVELNKDSESNNAGGNPKVYNPGARFTINVDDGIGFDLESDKKYSEIGFTEADAGGWAKVSLANVGIPEGATSFKLTNNNNGYGMWIYAVRLFRTGKYVKPAMNAVFTAGTCRIECENYTDASAEKAPVVEEEQTYISGGPASWSASNVTFIVKFDEAKHVKLVLRYNYSKGASWGSSSAASITFDGTALYSANGENANFGLGEGQPSSEWTTEESVEFDITAGTHTFVFSGPGYGGAVNWDYFELVEVVPQVQPQE